MQSISSRNVLLSEETLSQESESLNLLSQNDTSFFRPSSLPLSHNRSQTVLQNTISSTTNLGSVESPEQKAEALSIEEQLSETTLEPALIDPNNS